MLALLEPPIKVLAMPAKKLYREGCLGSAAAAACATCVAAEAAEGRPGAEEEEVGAAEGAGAAAAAAARMGAENSLICALSPATTAL